MGAIVLEFLKKRWKQFAVVALLVVQAGMFAVVVHRESLTFDEDDHMYAGYRMWTAGDYGLNPEHPPLVKLLATLPLLTEKLWTPPLQGRFFKDEAYLDGRDWLATVDGAGQRLVFRMRLAAGLLAIGLSLMVYFAAKAWFGERAALVALVLVVFEPNVLGHSALVTTDVGVSLFFLAAVFAFWWYVQRPSVVRLVVAGVVAGCLLATKHSGILLAPMLLALIGWEVWQTPENEVGKKQRLRRAGGMLGAFAAIVVIGVVTLWAFYGFRYSARPAGLVMNPTLTEYMVGLSGFDRAGIGFFQWTHLLPESYLMGLVDVKKMAEFYPTFVLGQVYAHGKWWYFPVVLVIKSTLGLMALVGIGVWVFFLRREFFWRKTRSKEQEHVRHALVYLLLPGAVYLAVAMGSGMNIGSRHVLPLYALGAIFAGAAVAKISIKGRVWVWVVALLVALHAGSGMRAFPVPMAYANEAWGGPENLHTLLSDANVDWAQQLISVKHWQDAHPNEECWFAYFAQTTVRPEEYGITCHNLSNANSYFNKDMLEKIPAEVNGTVLISAGDLSGCEWPSDGLNPFREFKSRKPDEMIDYGVLVYRGQFDMRTEAAFSRTERAHVLLDENKPQEALVEAEEAVAIRPWDLMALTAEGDAAAAVGDKELARKAWSGALETAKTLEPDAQVSYVGDLEEKVKKTGNRD
jgi:4-amino-4-deoxy-L-arabinose transferase-like glycosyltransferase